MTLREIFRLSLCSFKTANIVKCHLRKSIKCPLFVHTSIKNTITFGFIRKGNHVILMTLQDNRASNERKFEKVNIGGMKREVSKNKSYYELFGGSFIGMVRFFINKLPEP
uniref:F-box domain-containing protein n=1 Tax=Caenorhabditis tropicalis TaxID=1561998 RepID=A0A1I7T0H0_9PELO